MTKEPTEESTNYNPPATSGVFCFYMVYRLRVTFTFINDWEIKKKRIFNESNIKFKFQCPQ